MIKFAFIGGTLSGLELLQALIKNSYLPQYAVILKEDVHEINKYYSVISELLKTYKIPFSVKRKLTDTDYNIMKDSNLDFAIVLGWRTLINTDYSKYLKYGFIAAHRSLLPKYRGFAPTQWVIINGEKETGVTLFQIEEGETDSGSVFDQRKIPVLQDEYAIDLEHRMNDCTIEMFVDFFKKYDGNNLKSHKQDETKATYTCKRIPEDGIINWNKSSLEIYNFIRALANPFPGAFCYYKNSCYHIRKAILGENNKKNFIGLIPGRVIKIKENGIEILCGKGTLLITEWENKSDGTINNPCENIKSITATLK